MSPPRGASLVGIGLGIGGLALATICAGSGALALGGGYFPRLDLLGNLAPVFVCGALVAALLALPAPPALRRIAQLVALLAVIESGALMLPELLRRTGPTAPLDAPGQIKVIEFNAWRENTQRVRIAAWLQSENPDIAVIVEATPALRDAIVARTGWSVAGARSNTMIFSHRPYLTMVRPQASSASQVDWVNATFASATGPFEVVATHQAWPTSRIQPRQRAGLRDVLSQRPQRRMVLVGDFNSTPWSFSLRHDDTALGLIRRDRAVPTWPARGAGSTGWAPVAILPIDHVYAGPGWAVTSLKRGPQLGSDHYPLVVTLAPIAVAEATP